MSLKAREAESRIKVQEALPIPRSGGRQDPTSIRTCIKSQAGDWRISYAVEQNHLAILVLEVLNPDERQKDPARETMTRKMKVKLLDCEGSPSRTCLQRPRKKVKIRLLDLADEVQGEDAPQPRAGARIRLQGTGPGSGRSPRITLRDAAAEPDGDSLARPTAAEADLPRGRKITPWIRPRCRWFAPDA